MRGRQVETTYLYEDPEHPGRVTKTLISPAWTADDRALLLGLDLYESGMCSCGQPKDVAWHELTDGEWEPERAVCHACTALQGHQVVYQSAVLHMPAERRALMSPFVWGETTTEPSPPDTGNN